MDNSHKSVNSVQKKLEASPNGCLAFLIDDPGQFCCLPPLPQDRQREMAVEGRAAMTPILFGLGLIRPQGRQWWHYLLSRVQHSGACPGA